MPEVRDDTYNINYMSKVLIKESSRKGALPSSEKLEDWIDNYDIMISYHVSQRTLQSLRSNGQLAYTIFANRCFYRKVDVQALFKSRYRKTVSKKGQIKYRKASSDCGNAKIIGGASANGKASVNDMEDKPCQ